MKTTIGVCMLCLFFELHGKENDSLFQQLLHHKKIGLTWNVLNPTGLGVEFPLAKQMSLELYYRNALQILPSAFTGIDYQRINYKAHLKYHFDSKKEKKKLNSKFVMLSMNWRDNHIVEHDRTSGSTYFETYINNTMFFLQAGFGKRNKSMQFWVSGGYVVYTKENNQKRYINNMFNMDSEPREPYIFSVGIEFYLFQVNLRKYK